MDQELEREKLALERERLRADSELRGRELDLRAQELKSTSGKGLQVTGAQATILVALISFASAAIGAGISGYFQREVGDIEAAGDQNVEQIRAKAQIDLEQLKFESGLIIRAIEQDTSDDRIKLLKFFANAGLIPRHKESILEISENPEAVPSIGGATPRCPFVKRDVVFVVNDSVEEPVASHLMEQLTEVYRQWSLASGLSISQTQDVEDADIIVGYAETDGPVVAYSEFPCDGRKARIHLNREQNWGGTSSSNGAESDGRFLFTVLLHEAGHTIGLLHNEMSGTIMSMPPPDLVELTSSDLSAARALYGLPERR